MIESVHCRSTYLFWDLCFVYSNMKINKQSYVEAFNFFQSPITHADGYKLQLATCMSLSVTTISILSHLVDDEMLVA